MGIQTTAMKTTILTHGSGIVADSTDVRADEFFQGASFRPLHPLIEEFKKHGKVSTYILSDEYGFLYGDAPVSESEVEITEPQVLETFLDEVQDSDVVGVFLTRDEFEAFIIENWDTIVETVKPESVWCISGSRSSLNEVEITGLEERGCTIITYNRVGVAPIGVETREEFIETALEQVID